LNGYWKNKVKNIKVEMKLSFRVVDGENKKPVIL